jgi:pimeloyl-ACP methyl ester carboxylesterase
MNVIAALLLGVLLAVLTGLYVFRSQEREELTDAARKAAPGSFVKLQDGFVHYELAGPADGRPVVLVHGFSTWSFTWDAAFRSLAEAGFRVLRYDLYGRGYSDRPDIDYTEDLFDRQLLGLLAALGIHERVDLVGNSMGGLIVTTFAARHSGQVRTLALIDPAFFFLERVPFPLEIPLIGDFAGRVFVVPFIAKAQTRDFKHPEQFIDYDQRYRMQMRYKGFSRAILSTIRSLPGGNVMSDLERASRTNIPVLLIWGREDRTVPLAVSDKVRAIAPRAEFHVIDDAAHMPHYERPETVNPIIIRFLARK